MTFKEIYAQIKQQPRPEAPGTVFVREIAAVTKKSELTVRRWLSDTDTASVPDALTQEVLARHLNTTPEELFPMITTARNK